MPRRSVRSSMGKHFDRICGVFAERHWRSNRLRTHVREARLFTFPSREDRNTRLGTYAAFGGDVETLIDNFSMPFSVVAVEDPVSCVVVVDAEAGQRGLNAPRTFVECYDATDRGMPPGVSALVISRIVAAKKGTTHPVEYTGELGLAMMGSKRRGLLIQPRQFEMTAKLHGEWSIIAAEALRSATVTLERLLSYRAPGFVCVREPAKKPRRSARVRAEFLRSDERDTYRIMRMEDLDPAGGYEVHL